jgi:hypothetical protein
MPRAQARVLTDHDEIRRWAEERGAKPACVRGTGGKGDIGMLRLDFPGYSGAESLEHISWEDWSRKFDERSLALLVQDQMASGQKSNFNKLISRRTARARATGGLRPTTKRRSRATGRRSRPTTAAKSRSSKRTATAKKSSAKSKRRISSRRGSKRIASLRAQSTRAKTRATKSRRGSTKAKRTQSARGRAESRRRAA